MHPVVWIRLPSATGSQRWQVSVRAGGHVYPDLIDSSVNDASTAPTAPASEPAPIRPSPAASGRPDRGSPAWVFVLGGLAIAATAGGFALDRAHRVGRQLLRGAGQLTGERGGVAMVTASSVAEGVPAHVSPIPRTSVEPDEQRLIAAATAGDRHAYAQLLGRHQAVAFRAAYLINGSAVDAEDATQEACVKAWLALERFRPAAPFRPWLVQIAINEARNRQREAGRRAGLGLRLSADPAGLRAAPSAEAEALSAEQQARLAAALATLREDDQLVIAARYLLGLSETDTAIALGVRRGTVKSWLSRALGRLRTQLEQTG